MPIPHQYIERASGQVRTERLFGDQLIELLYNPVRERADWLFRLLTGPASSRALALLNFDLILGARLFGNHRFLSECGVNLAECLDPLSTLDTPRKVFERRIRYWECRPMPPAPAVVVSPADSRILTGSFDADKAVFIKEKFFSFSDLLGDRPAWLEAFAGGEYAVFRLTPDKYHYNHTPVSGQVVDIYTIDGTHHSCNPQAVVEVITPYSKNRRTVTVIDTDVPGGSGAGLVAMVEVVALMIGEILQCYSHERYDNPQPVAPGLFLRKGQPKSLYCPGSSTDLLLFQRGRIRFADDLLANQARRDVSSRFSHGFGQSLVETDLQVRSPIATALTRSGDTPCPPSFF
jgi:phosphatidylserine decarboxylase